MLNKQSSNYYLNYSLEMTQRLYTDNNSRAERIFMSTVNSTLFDLSRRINAKTDQYYIVL